VKARSGAQSSPSFRQLKVDSCYFKSLQFFTDAVTNHAAQLHDAQARAVCLMHAVYGKQ